MSYPKKALKLKPTHGLNFDIPANETSEEFYTAGDNVIFRQGFASRTGGYRAVYGTLPSAVYHLLNVRVDTTNFWLTWGAASVHALETSNEHDIEGSALQTVTQPYQYSSTILNGIPVFSNSLDSPQYWTGDVGDNFATLTDWPASTICKSIAAAKYHLFAMDIDGPSGHFESQVLWSNAAEPGTIPDSWTPAADNEAGSAELSDTPGPVLCMVPLRGSYIFYKRSSTYAADYVGGNEVFAFRTLLTSSGALTRHSVCDINGQHFVVTDGDIILTDGTNRLSVAQGRMKDYLFATLDQTNYENLFVIYNRGRNEVWVCYPETGNTYCTTALVYDVANDAFGIRDLATVKCAAIGIVNDTDPDESWAAATYTWDAATQYWGTSNFSLAVESMVLGYGTTMEMQDTDDAVATASSVGKYDLTFGDSERIKCVKRVHVRTASGSGTLYVRVGSKMHPNDSMTWATEVELDTATSQIVDAFAQGRYISVEVRSDDTDVWTVTGIDLEAELRGYF